MLGSRLLQSALCRGKAAPWGLGTAVAYSTSPPPLPPAPPSAPPVQAASPAKPVFASRGDYLRKLLVKDRLGASPAAASLRQVVRASVGGFLGIAALSIPHYHLLAGQVDTTFMLIGSFGASAALIASAPHSPLSQPWPVIAGHALSALSGVAAYVLLGPSLLHIACPLAVLGAIALMTPLRCFHPPGAATSLIAVLGPAGIHDLGWSFVLFPAATAPACIVLSGMLYNNLFADTRYPNNKP